MTHELSNLITFLNFKTSLVNLPHPTVFPTSLSTTTSTTTTTTCVRQNDTLRMKIDM